jgi:DNA-binding transcriptional ArsR family regulator
LQFLAESLIISGTPKQAQCTPNLEEIDAVFDALAHAARRQLILLLSYLGPELPSGYLAHRFAHSWPTTTRHLNILRRAGVVDVRREGRTSHYRLNRELLERVVGGWLDNLTPPSPEATWTSNGPKFSRGLRPPATAPSARSDTTKGTPL